MEELREELNKLREEVAELRALRGTGKGYMIKRNFE
jgi:ribosomal protein L29